MSLPGIPIEDIDTPALVIDLDLLESNIARMADFFSDKKANLRPHTKTHKTPILAHKQIEAGAQGVTCAKLGEAEVMAAAGIRDIGFKGNGALAEFTVPQEALDYALQRSGLS